MKADLFWFALIVAAIVFVTWHPLHCWDCAEPWR